MQSQNMAKDSGQSSNPKLDLWKVFLSIPKGISRVQLESELKLQMPEEECENVSDALIPVMTRTNRENDSHRIEKCNKFSHVIP